MVKKFFKEINNYKVTYRPVLPGLEQMLNANLDKKTLVKIRHLDVFYGHGLKKFKAINDLSLNIYQGEVLGLVGESGSGKTTIGRTIVGLNNYHHGLIYVDEKLVPKKFKRGWKWGKKLQAYKEILRHMVSNVQMIFQDPANSLNPNKNIEKVVSEGLDNFKNARKINLQNFDSEVIKFLIEKKIDQELAQFLQIFTSQIYFFVEQNWESVKTKIYLDFKNFLIDKKNTKFAKIIKFLEEKSHQRQKLELMSEKEAKKFLIINTLKQVGLDESVLNRYPLEFSGGQQQRIGITRSIVLRPKLLVADEPISSLDVSIQAQVVNIFNDLKTKYNLTLLFIAHDLRMVEYISDRIAVVYKGVLLEIGKTENIMKNPLHPYTKSLLDAVPSIKSKKTTLTNFIYNPNAHNYDLENQPIWNKISEDHFVLATEKEIENWKQNQYGKLKIKSQKMSLQTGEVSHGK